MNKSERIRPETPEKITGFEWETTAENVTVRTVMETAAFLPSPQLSGEPHDHAYFEAIVMTAGEAELVTPSGILKLSKNDLCILAPQTYHHARTSGEGGTAAISFFFSYRKNDREDTADLYGTLSEAFSALGSARVFPQAFGLAHGLFELVEEMGRHPAGKRERLGLKTSLCVFSLLDLVCPDARGEVEDKLSEETRLTRTIDLFFARNHTRDVTVRDLAEVIFLSERQTERVLADIYGLSFKQKLIEARVHAAMQYLLSTKLSVHEIAAKSGYRSDVGFHTAFKEHTGLTPAKYRAKMKAENK